MKLADIARPVLRSFPRPSMRLLGMLGAGYRDDRAWAAATPRYRALYDRALNAVVSSDLSLWCGRACYYFGRFYDQSHQALLRLLLRPGDTYVDIGANLGFHSLFARNLIGPGGTLVSVEPHPDTFALLSAHLAINRIRNCHSFNLALGETESEALLNQLEEHSGTATMRATTAAKRTIAVPVRRGDDVLGPLSFTGRVIIKIDVEGFEQQVLSGMPRILAGASAAVVEVTPEWIRNQGGDPLELYRSMRDQGFVPSLPTLPWRLGLFAQPIRMALLRSPLPQQHDVCFLRLDLAAELELPLP